MASIETKIQTELERPGSPVTCAICLERVSNKSFMDTCTHQFCFSCLSSWSKIKRECPLCKEEFNIIYYDVISATDYRRFIVPPPSIPIPISQAVSQNTLNRPAFLGEFFEDDYFNVTSASNRPFFAYRTTHRYAPSTTRVNPYRPRQNQNSSADASRQDLFHFNGFTREEIYLYNIDVVPPSDNGRFRTCTPEFYRENEAQLFRLVPWLTRDLTAIASSQLWRINTPCIVQHITNMLKTNPITDLSFRGYLSLYIHQFTSKFIQLFYDFARSPLDMVEYDRECVYLCREGLYSSEFDHLMQTLSRTSSTTSATSHNYNNAPSNANNNDASSVSHSVPEVLVSGSGENHHINGSNFRRYFRTEFSANTNGGGTINNSFSNSDNNHQSLINSLVNDTFNINNNNNNIGSSRASVLRFAVGNDQQRVQGTQNQAINLSTTMRDPTNLRAGAPMSNISHAAFSNMANAFRLSVRLSRVHDNNNLPRTETAAPVTAAATTTTTTGTNESAVVNPRTSFFNLRSRINLPIILPPLPLLNETSSSSTSNLSSSRNAAETSRNGSAARPKPATFFPPASSSGDSSGSSYSRNRSSSHINQCAINHGSRANNNSSSSWSIPTINISDSGDERRPDHDSSDSDDCVIIDVVDRKKEIIIISDSEDVAAAILPSSSDRDFSSATDIEILNGNKRSDIAGYNNNNSNNNNNNNTMISAAATTSYATSVKKLTRKRKAAYDSSGNSSIDNNNIPSRRKNFSDSETSSETEEDELYLDTWQRTSNSTTNNKTLRTVPPKKWGAIKRRQEESLKKDRLLSKNGSKSSDTKKNNRKKKKKKAVSGKKPKLAIDGSDGTAANKRTRNSKLSTKLSSSLVGTTDSSSDNEVSYTIERLQKRLNRTYPSGCSSRSSSASSVEVIHSAEDFIDAKNYGTTNATTTLTKPSRVVASGGTSSSTADAILNSTASNSSSDYCSHHGGNHSASSNYDPLEGTSNAKLSSGVRACTRRPVKYTFSSSSSSSDDF